MQITLLKAKLHRVTTTHCELDYEGSCAIDETLLKASGIREFEQLHIYNVTNGERFSTYAIVAEAGSGVISLNGAAAHKADVGDILIIASYAQMTEDEAEQFQPRLVYAGDNNRVQSTSANIAPQEYS